VRRAVTGLRAWLVQRISAVYMLLFMLVLFVHFLVDPPHDYLAWHDWIRNPYISIAVFVFFAALLLHAWVGVRDVLMDYVHPLALRVTALAMLGFCLMAIATWAVRILLIGNR
jgi:succinate dehydrogenase / fumarate reductase membrane anchor subunit